MSYTIKDVSDRLKLSPYAIWFYDKKGLLPFVLRNHAGNREFTESDINMMQTICCLKDTGMQIKNIKQYIDLCMKGTDTIALRGEILSDHKKEIHRQMEKLNENLNLLNAKIEVYESPDAEEIIGERLQRAAEEKRVAVLK